MRDNEKKTKTLLTLLCIAFLLVLCLGGYLIYDKLLSKNGAAYNYDLKKRTTVQAVRNENVEILVDMDGNAYLYFIGNPNNGENEQYKANIQKIKQQFNNYNPRGYSYIDGSNELKAYKINIDGVLTSYSVYKGNGGLSYFVFVKENGKLSYLSYEKILNTGEIKLNNIDNLDNIISIVENTYSMIPYAIDSSGKEISLYDYIK